MTGALVESAARNCQIVMMMMMMMMMLMLIHPEARGQPVPPHLI